MSSTPTRFDDRQQDDLRPDRRLRRIRKGWRSCYRSPTTRPFIVTELWNEFIAAPIPADALASLTTTYLPSGTQLQPLLAGILSHPLIFDSLEEPTMIKSPVVYTVGVLRTPPAPRCDGWSRPRARRHAAAALPPAERRRLAKAGSRG